ncbi:MAG: hypothetical protein EPN86_04510 [Nanoarchaeota archaeon]|nr:MAG: hypothetical protein EPN86_04510 [Nanoarchaeota archaeon]
MRTVYYTKVGHDKISSEQSTDLVEKLMRELGGGLSKKDAIDVDMVLRVAFRKILTLLDHDLEGRVILDLGCGSRPCDGNYQDYSGYSPRRFEPWLCRALHKLETNPEKYGLSQGPHPIGVDIIPQIGEGFESYQRDLTQAKSLDMLPRNSVDLANESFFTSPTLLSMPGSKDVFRTVQAELVPVVKKGGIFLVNSLYQ